MIIRDRERSYRAETGQMFKRLIKQDYEDNSGVFHTSMEVYQSDRIVGASHLYVGIHREFTTEQARTQADLEWAYAEEWLKSNDARLMPFHKEKVRDKLGVNTEGQPLTEEDKKNSTKVESGKA